MKAYNMPYLEENPHLLPLHIDYLLVSIADLGTREWSRRVIIRI